MPATKSPQKVSPFQKEERYAAACRELATLTVPSDLPDSIKRLEQFHVSFNEEELRQDERLAYILGR